MIIACPAILMCVAYYRLATLCTGLHGLLIVCMADWQAAGMLKSLFVWLQFSC